MERGVSFHIFSGFYNNQFYDHFFQNILLKMRKRAFQLSDYPVHDF